MLQIRHFFKNAMKIFVVFLLLIFAVSCKKDEPDTENVGAVQASVCGVNYPMRELP